MLEFLLIGFVIGRLRRMDFGVHKGIYLDTGKYYYPVITKDYDWEKRKHWLRIGRFALGGGVPSIKRGAQP